jgi:hypothetical protein
VSRPGRPALDENDRSAQICVSVTARKYDQVYQRAQRERISVPEVIRRALDRELREKDREKK